jgi:hypothetical protein
MRKEKDLIKLLRGLVGLLSDEVMRNPEFAARLDALLEPIPGGRRSAKSADARKPSVEAPDIYTEWSARGATDFSLWLRDQPIGVLRAIVRQHDMDAARRTAKWKETEKLAAFVAEHVAARVARGASFMRKG